MIYTKKYPQVSKTAAKAKFNRMAKGAGKIANGGYFECRFSTWILGKDLDDDLNDCNSYAIYASSSYHVEASLDSMYKSNCRNW